MMKPSDVSEKRSEEGSSVINNISDAPSSSQFTEYLNVRRASQCSVLKLLPPMRLRGQTRGCAHWYLGSRCRGGGRFQLSSPVWGSVSPLCRPLLALPARHSWWDVVLFFWSLLTWVSIPKPFTPSLPSYFWICRQCLQSLARSLLGCSGRLWVLTGVRPNFP